MALGLSGVLFLHHKVTVAAVACKGTEVLPLVVDFSTALP
jgi:hypothetical protein